MPTNTRSGKILHLTAPAACEIEDSMDIEGHSEEQITELPGNVVISCPEQEVATLAPIPQYDFGAIVA